MGDKKNIDVLGGVLIFIDLILIVLYIFYCIYMERLIKIKNKLKHIDFKNDIDYDDLKINIKFLGKNIGEEIKKDFFKFADDDWRGIGSWKRYEDESKNETDYKEYINKYNKAFKAMIILACFVLACTLFVLLALNISAGPGLVILILSTVGLICPFFIII